MFYSQRSKKSNTLTNKVLNSIEKEGKERDSENKKFKSLEVIC